MRVGTENTRETLLAAMKRHCVNSGQGNEAARFEREHKRRINVCFLGKYVNNGLFGKN